MVWFQSSPLGHHEVAPNSWFVRNNLLPFFCLFLNFCISHSSHKINRKTSTEPCSEWRGAEKLLSHNIRGFSCRLSAWNKTETWYYLGKNVGDKILKKVFIKLETIATWCKTVVPEPKKKTFFDIRHNFTQNTEKKLNWK